MHVEGTFGVHISRAGWVVYLGHVQDMLVPGGRAALGSNRHAAPDRHHYCLVNGQASACKHYIVGDSYSVLLAPYVVLKRSNSLKVTNRFRRFGSLNYCRFV